MAILLFSQKSTNTINTFQYQVHAEFLLLNKISYILETFDVFLFKCQKFKSLFWSNRLNNCCLYITKALVSDLQQDHPRVMVDPMLLIGLDCPDRLRLPW